MGSTNRTIAAKLSPAEIPDPDEAREGKFAFHSGGGSADTTREVSGGELGNRRKRFPPAREAAMSPTDRCDEVIRLIDGVLDEDDEAAEVESSANHDPPEIESVRGQWGVYYLRPSTV